jgi:hypothetical protein
MILARAARMNVRCIDDCAAADRDAATNNIAMFRDCCFSPRSSLRRARV